VTGDGPRRPLIKVLQVRLTVGSTLLVIGAVVTALTIVNLFEAARRPVAWAVAASVAAWLLSWVISLLDRWIPRPLAVLTTVLGFVILVAGGWVGVRATLQLEVDKLRTALPAAAQDLEQRYDAAASFHLAQRTQAFVNSLDERFGTQAQVAAAAGTASTYVVAGVLMLFLVAYGPRFVSSALRQIADPVRRESVAAVLYRGSNAARAYLLIALVQTIAITAICSVIFYFLDLPAPFILGLLVGWLSAIPYLGIILSGLAPLLAAATEPHEFTYAVLVALLVGLQLVEALVIRPRVDSRTIRVGPALMLIGTLIGFELYGVGGAVYGTALLVLLWAVLQVMPDRESWPVPSESAVIAGAGQPDAAAAQPSELQAPHNPVSGGGDVDPTVDPEHGDPAR
jgi:predicted PurR-regulated permease PerM